MSPSLDENPWLIALATIPLTGLFGLIFKVLIDWIGSRRGRLTGTYLALTEDVRGELQAELVRCRQTGNRLVGRIQAVCRVHLPDVQVKEDIRAAGRFKFSGRTAGPIVYLLYWEPRRPEQGGSITFKSTVIADVLDGTWSGLDISQKIGHASCTWIRVRKQDFPTKDLTAFTAAIKATLAVTSTRWRVQHGSTAPGG